jgi:hypothetical protein
MMTPVCTDTPNSARKPTPEETLKLVPVIRRASRPPTLTHHAKIQGAQRQKVGGNAPQVQTNGCEQQRKRNRRRNDQRGPNVAEEYKQDDRYQDHSIREVVQHGVRGEVNQIATPWFIRS